MDPDVPPKILNKVTAIPLSIYAEESDDMVVSQLSWADGNVTAIAYSIQRGDLHNGYGRDAIRITNQLESSEF